mgnify:FL=1
MSNYPPGVTGNEYEIAGPDYERESDTYCSECGAQMIAQGYRDRHWMTCPACNHQEDTEL